MQRCLRAKYSNVRVKLYIHITCLTDILSAIPALSQFPECQKGFHNFGKDYMYQLPHSNYSNIGLILSFMSLQIQAV